jgi:hypothetical protein
MIAIVFMFWVSFVALVGFCGYVILRATLQAIMGFLCCHGIISCCGLVDHDCDCASKVPLDKDKK